MISPDASPDLLEAIWEAGERFGRRLGVPEQVAVARVLARTPPHELRLSDVKEAFASAGLAPPTAAYSQVLITRAKLIAPAASLRQTVIEYRHFAIRSLSQQFGGKTTGREEELRNSLLTYLRRGYTEARTGRGRTDILLPSPPAIIEVKVWGGTRDYEDGLEELARYINTEQPSEALMIVFGDREPLPAIVNDHRQAVAEEHELEGLRVPVIVVPFEVDAPSKAAANARRRERA